MTRYAIHPYGISLRVLACRIYRHPLMIELVPGGLQLRQAAAATIGADVFRVGPSSCRGYYCILMRQLELSALVEQQHIDYEITHSAPDVAESEQD